LIFKEAYQNAPDVMNSSIVNKAGYEGYCRFLLKKIRCYMVSEEGLLNVSKSICCYMFNHNETYCV
jgi:hypothetical protein